MARSAALHHYWTFYLAISHHVSESSNELTFRNTRPALHIEINTDIYALAASGIIFLLYS
jgi:hypothetical protein